MRVPLIILIIIGPATAAFGEDQWALWDQSVYAVKDQEPAVLWTQWGSPTTKAECEQRRRKEVQPYEQMSKSFPSRWSKQGDAFVSKDGGEVIQTISYFCYPITTNPRWEHIATRGNWYLMGPPRSGYDKTAAYLRAYRVWPDRALNMWDLLDAFESRQVCEIMRDSLRRIEETSYRKAATAYLKTTADQNEPALVSLQRFFVETYYANLRTYNASRCVFRDDPRLPHGLKRRP